MFGAISGDNSPIEGTGVTGGGTRDGRSRTSVAWTVSVEEGFEKWCSWLGGPMRRRLGS